MLAVDIFWLLFASVVAYLFLLKRVDLPSHLLGHDLIYDENLIPASAAGELRDLIKIMKEYPSNINADMKTGGFKVYYEHIGEAESIGADGSCSNNLLVPNSERTHCILPQRIDVGKQFIITGGPDGLREGRDSMVSRVSSFGRYMMGEHDIEKYPVVKSLFESDSFQNAAKKICPAHKQILDPFQFNFIIQVPGQTVALHLDAPWFWGATRFQYPQWLLVAMVFSNLFSERFVDQVQIVGYLHDRVYRSEDGGDFIFYASNDPQYSSVPSIPLSGLSVDGSKTVHAANTYRPSDSFPILSKDKDSILTYMGNDSWSLMVDGESLKDYSSSDLRISIVYRARCFETKQDVVNYRLLARNNEAALQLEDILHTFKLDLVKRGKLSGINQSMSKLDLAKLIMDTYIQYPLPSWKTAIFPYNYALVEEIMKYF